MNMISLAIAIAVIVEAVLEYFKSGYEAFQEKKYGKIAYYAVALLLCLLFCFWGQVDVFSVFGISFGAKWIGIALTALFASRGASYLRSLLEKIES